MGILKPVFGVGQFIGNHILYGNNTYVSDAEITTGFSLEIGFYSLTGEYVGGVSTTPDSVGWIDFSVLIKKIGGLHSFSFSISRNLDIPFFDQMETRFTFQGVHWFTGELNYKPELATSNTKYEFEGIGYISYLKKIKKITVTYTSKTFLYIISDLIETYIYGNTPILYNLELIDVPDITISNLEIKNKSLDKIFDILLGIANSQYKTIQYEYGVDKDRQIYFRPINNEVYRGFFEGFQIQDPEIKSNTKDIVNKVNIYRPQTGTDTLEFVSTVDDTNSQEKYGIASRDIEIADFLDQTTAELIASGIIDRLKDPKYTINIKVLDVESNPYPIAFYNINSRISDYNMIVDNFENTSDWTLNISNTTITINTIKVFSGRRCFKVVTTTGSYGEYIEYILDEPYYYPNLLRIFLAQNDIGTTLKLVAYDNNNNYIEAEIGIGIKEDFWRYILDISNLDNLKKIRIYFITNDSRTLYLDHLDVTTYAWSQKTLVLNQSEYILDRNKLLCKSQFGEDLFDYISEIKKIKDQNDNIFDILKRG